MGSDRHFAWQQSSGPNVRFGSKADITECPINVRFTPKSGHWNSVVECPLCAKSGHWQLLARHPNPTIYTEVVLRGSFKRNASGTVASVIVETITTVPGIPMRSLRNPATGGETAAAPIAIV